MAERYTGDLEMGRNFLLERLEEAEKENYWNEDNTPVLDIYVAFLQNFLVTYVEGDEPAFDHLIQDLLERFKDHPNFKNEWLV